MKPAKVHSVESLLANCDHEGDCCRWRGGLGNGVPHVYHQGKVIQVRRLLLILQGKEIKPNSYYASICRDELCVAPGHITRRDASTHMRRMTEEALKPTNTTKKKAAMIAWRRTNGIKLTFETAKVIRQDERPETEIAQEYGISRSMVGKIRRGEQWPDVAGNPFAHLGQRVL